MDWSACRTRGSAAKQDWIWWKNEVSMRLIKSKGERRVSPLFSEMAEGRRSGQQDRVSRPAS